MFKFKTFRIPNFLLRKYFNKWTHNLSLSWIFPLDPLSKPDLLAATRPAFYPGTACLLTQEPWPIWVWLPPPWGWSTGFIFTQEIVGQHDLLTLCL